MKRFLILLLLFFTTESFATGIGNVASAPCDNDTLSKYTGTANVEINWEPNTINLNWYNGDTKLTVANNSQSCIYDGTLTVPAQPTKPGYTFNGWKVIRVPGGFTELEYIETTGTQYILTGVITDVTGLKTETKLSLTTDITSEMAIIGRAAPGGYEVLFGPSGTTAGVWHKNINGGAYVSMNYVPNVIYIMATEVTDNKITAEVNGITNSLNMNVPPLASSAEITLFRHGLLYYPILAKVYYVKLWEDGNMVRNFIPAQRNSDNVVGMYDSITNQFFTNAGTGSFVAGPAVE